MLLNCSVEHRKECPLLPIKSIVTDLTPYLSYFSPSSEVLEFSLESQPPPVANHSPTIVIPNYSSYPASRTLPVRSPGALGLFPCSGVSLNWLHTHIRIRDCRCIEKYDDRTNGILCGCEREYRHFGWRSTSLGATWLRDYLLSVRDDSLILGG
ncbi:hypothetical protein BDV95DRAFT_257402 [Massariosphaeria phaeospora]|uniref:Uncharacterized protein n=1 Tax=Massariosphaeria phaeospora TaxID=100035 RepID=A0A7C8MBH4_9PLEO|nr:hypothetical protein BDV95DRAFT_257402 [Massariosphaeria phaeospora]